MCSPARVGYPSMAIEDFAEIWFGFVDQLLQFGHLPYFLEGKHFIFLVTVNGEASRVISTVLQARQAWIN